LIIATQQLGIQPFPVGKGGGAHRGPLPDLLHIPQHQLQLQDPSLTNYAIGSEARTTLTYEPLHQDPNLNYAASVASVLTRLPRSEKLTPIETMKLAAGEVAGEKSIKTLAEVIDTLNQDPDITKRFGQKGLGQRNLGRAIQLLIESSETNEGRCMFAYDIFTALERVILDYVTDANDRAKYLEDLKTRQGTLPRTHHDRNVQRLYG
jgi:serine protein kinase